MKRSVKRVISLILSAAMLMGYMPLSAFADIINAPDKYTLNNGFLEVSVSAKNGSFHVRTVEGNKLNKDDNNKNLLFPNDDDNTSFTSFKVTRNGVSKDYIFGGKYGFLGLTDQFVVINQDATGITASWGVDDLKFIQRIELANSGSNNHGMAYISYTVENEGEPADVSARILMDTALGYQDFAIYELSGADGTYNRVEKESIYSNAEKNLYEKTFFAYDDVNNPTILAYTVNASVNEIECIPEKVAFGHWNNLAASVFDFIPDSEITFTNPYNKKYLTADSAYAMYYDVGRVVKDVPATVATYYGVYSNEKISDKSNVALNISAPSSMILSEDKTNYISQVDGGNPGDFTIQTSIENFVSDTSRNYNKVKVAVYCQTGITPVNDDGILQSEAGYYNPYTKSIDDFKVEENKSISWKFNASVGAEAAYRKIHFKVYNISPDVDPTGSGQLLEENLLGEGMCYILCPGGDGILPEIKFTSSAPEIIYNQGTRHIFFTGTNFNMLENKSEYTVIAKSRTNEKISYVIPSEQFIIDAEKNSIDVVFKQDMEIGNYNLVIDYTDAGVKDISAPAMEFTVSDDKTYRNDGYGVLAIVKKGANTNSKYEIKAFASESAYKDAKGLGEVLIELRGEFTATDQVADDGTVLKYTGVSTGKGNNVMTVNNSMDVENGSLTVEISNYGTDSQAINVDFDADLYTTGARTTIWKSGGAVLTSIENGTEYGLIAYDANGNRQNSTEDREPISLVWPSAAGAAQTIAGMIFEFRYGDFGVIRNGSNERRVLSFGAMLDLSFLIPSNAEQSPVQLDLFDKINLAFLEDNSYSSEHMRSAWEYHKDQVKLDQKADEGVGAIKVRDILFGGEYIGFNTEINLQIPGYTPAMPTMAANLKINTIGDWEVGVQGNLKFTKIEMEAEIVIMSKDGYPVPDKLYFFIKGFTPGVNIDGFGVVWLQGGGGGIDKLYDTIFAADSIPPLKILISAQLSLLQAFSARADLSLSLRGIGIKVSDGVISNTDIKVLNHAQLQFEWYPEFYFMAAVSVNILEIITGGGYIVVQDDGFFEFYVHASVKIPDVVLFIGGMHLGNVYLGANSRRIWGGIKVIGISAGICYYWGGDFDFGFGGNAPQPSFPELLGVDDVPVYKDPETGRVLYMHVGTNFELAAQSELVDNIDYAPVLMDAGTSVKVQSNGEKREHALELGDRQGENDGLLSISYNAGSKEEALEIAENIKITNEGNSEEYAIKLYDGNYDAASDENKNANANITYNSETGRAGLSITFTDDSVYNKRWKFTTDVAADLVLYNVLPMASLDTVNTSVTGDELSLTWNGQQLDKFQSISFMAVESLDDMEGTLIYKTENVDEIKGGSKTITLPDNLQSGTYYVRATAVKEGELCETTVSANTFQFTNSKIPSSPKGVAVSNGGDYQFDVEVTPPEGEFDGYLINIYEKSDDGWTISHMGGMTYEKDAAKLSVGGRYSYTYKLEDGTEITETRGLESGEKYKVGVSAYSHDNSTGKVYYSKEIMSGEIELAEPNTPNVTISAPGAVSVSYDNGEAKRVNVDTYIESDVTFNLISNQKVWGTWSLDGVDEDEAGKRVVNGSDNYRIELKDIEDGNHMLTFIGTNVAGDSVIVQKRFAVDTMPPRLLLEAPLNGCFFDEDGSIEIKGITDLGAKILINETSYAPKIGSDGTFSQEIKVDETRASNEVMISVSDEAGNTVSQSVILLNRALGKVNGLKLYADGLDVTNMSLTGGDDLTSQETKQLILKAEISDGDEIVLNNSSLVSWEAVAASGSAVMEEDGTFTMLPGARGMITGKLMVSDEGSMTAAAIFGAQNEGSKKDTSNYLINIVQPANGGSISASHSLAKPGTLISVTAVPDSGYSLKHVVVNGGAIEGTTFVMPAGNVTVTAEFEANSGGGSTGGGKGGTSSTKPVPEEVPQISTNEIFTDVKGHWAEKYIKEVVERGLFMGVDESHFAPELGMTRGMFVTVMGRMEKVDRKGLKPGFTDVDANMYYAPYVAWATDQNIVKGADENMFMPDMLISREQISVLLYRYALNKGYGTEIENMASLEEFKDYDHISSYALEAMQWAVSNKIVQGGSGGGLYPSDNATRAEVAAMIMRFINIYEQ